MNWATYLIKEAMAGRALRMVGKAFKKKKPSNPGPLFQIPKPPSSKDIQERLKDIPGVDWRRAAVAKKVPKKTKSRYPRAKKKYTDPKD